MSGRADVLHVQIIAAVVVRRERIASTDGISLGAARARVQESDRARRDYLRRAYDVDCNDPQLYDLVINTGRLALKSAADVIDTGLTRKTGITYSASPSAPPLRNLP